MKKWLVLCLAFMMVFSGQTWAAEGDQPEPELISANQVEIKFSLGDSTILINGNEVTVETPYVVNGRTMVPLRVITEAFGADITWNGETKTVGLIYGDQTINVTIGNKTAMVNGAAIEMENAPEIRNRRTMVPLRFIAENFGAEVSFDAETRQILIVGSKQATEEPIAKDDEGSDVFNADVDKTKIGDSYYGWTLNYPNDMEKNYQNFKGDWVRFQDANGEYTLMIEVEKGNRRNVPDNTLIKKLEEYMYNSESVLSVGNGETNGFSYVKMITKDDDATHYEYRAYVNNGNIYLVILTMNNEEDFNNQLKYQGYQALLDSFTPSFDEEDASIKNISNVVDGQREYTNEDYGLSLRIPAEWDQDKSNEDIYFSNKEDTEYVMVRITSVVEDDTLDQWVDRQGQLMSEYFVKDHVEIGRVSETEIASVPAIERTLKYNMGDKWRSEYHFYLFKNNYKFYVEIGHENLSEQEAHELKNAVLDSLTIDSEKMNPSLGFIRDEKDFIDKSKTMTLSSETYNYTMEIPEFWEENAYKDDGGTIIYTFFSGNFQLNIVEDDLDTVVDDTMTYMRQLEGQMSNFDFKSKRRTRLFGEAAYEITYELNIDGIVLDSTSYVVYKDGYTYIFDLQIVEATSTDENLDRLDQVLHSFEFTTDQE